MEEGGWLKFILRDSVAVASVPYYFHLGLLLGALTSSWRCGVGPSSGAALALVHSTWVLLQTCRECLYHSLCVCASLSPLSLSLSLSLCLVGTQVVLQQRWCGSSRDPVQDQFLLFFELWAVAGFWLSMCGDGYSQRQRCANRPGAWFVLAGSLAEVVRMI